ncbi:MAG: Succinyl-diaminopimelate desuccinylase [Acetothermia bacterium 64_32]|nr:MAG: Succinyl-diaminopimelate desuccinylase [Acetothermia bacterium 64_32]
MAWERLPRAVIAIAAKSHPFMSVGILADRAWGCYWRRGSAARDIIWPMVDPIRLAQGLVRFSSVSGEEGAAADFLLRALRTICDVELGPGGAVVGALERGRGPRLLLTGHLDTVPPGDEAAWSVPPFSGEVREGRLYGRGAVDMKGAIAAQVAGAAQALPEIQGTLLFAYVTHEETAEGVVLGKVLDRLPRPDLVVLGEPTDLRLAIGHRGRAILKVEAHGRTAHASMPELGDNAIQRMMAALPRILALPLPHDPMLGKGTVTPVSISTPTSGPIVPDRCSVLLDRRLVRGERPDSVLSLYRELDLGVRVEIVREELRAYTGEILEVEGFFPAWLMDPQDEWVVRAQRALGGVPLKVWRFSTDGVESCGRRGIPTVGYGPGDERLAHQPDEFLSISDLEAAVEGYWRLLIELMRPEEKHSRPKGTRRRRRGKGQRSR